MVKKKCLAIILAFFVLLSLFSVGVAAAQPKEVLVDQYTETYADGSYAIVSVYQSESLARDGSISGHKDFNYYDAGLAWTYTVYGTFTYTGGSATCQAASCTYSIINHAWYCTSTSAWPSGNAAVASGTMRNGSNGNEAYSSVTLYCSPSGTLY